MSTNFKIGDTVRLKTGGPPMTVNLKADPSKSPDAWVCSWFDLKRNLKKGTFSDDALEAASDRHRDSKEA